MQEPTSAAQASTCCASASQLRDFYGPLLATVTATKSAYDAMVRQHSPDSSAQGFQAEVRAAPGGEEARAYRWGLWGWLETGSALRAAVLLAGLRVLVQSQQCQVACSWPARACLQLSSAVLASSRRS